MNTSARWLANSSTFSASLLVQGPGGVEFLRIGWSGVRGFFLHLIGVQMELSSRLREETYAAKDAFRSSWRAALSLLLALLNRRRSSEALVVCHCDLAVRFIATKRLISEGKLRAWLSGCRLGVAA